MTFCWEFAEEGTCQFGETCRYDHVAGPEINQYQQNPLEAYENPELFQSSTNHIAAFFAQYPTYHYDPSNSFMSEFYAMCDQFDWKRDHKERGEARDLLQNAMVFQFNATYGTAMNDLEAWQSLCRALDVDPVPNNMSECRKLVKKTHVNICDLVEAPTLGPPRIFPTEEALASYTRSTGRIFPRANIHAGAILRDLLRRIFVSISNDDDCESI